MIIKDHYSIDNTRTSQIIKYIIKKSSAHHLWSPGVSEPAKEALKFYSSMRYKLVPKFNKMKFYTNTF